ncbi:MAG TPA: DUF805 domain-containing protein [Candidatus Poseidoniales archaeon]|nr:MAG: DUF805 domain-containing protein [Euryarchaeota archaeon]HIG34069.1 DUF805 domain-containing protein [Candidatus Poseidoniales archaeon]
MGFMDALTSVFRNNYATFSGRASRSEYWWSYLGTSIFSMIAQIVAFAGAAALLDVNKSLAGAILIVLAVVILGIIIPFLAVSVRRMHDTGRSGWMMLLFFIPCIGIILMLVWFLDAGQPHVNAYGSVPTNKLE